MNHHHAALALALAGCTSSAPDHRLPGAALDDTPSSPPAASLGSSGNARPCGYDYTSDSTLSGPPIHIHDLARITYDAAGRDILEQGIDDDNHVAFRYTTEYDAMGNPVVDTSVSAAQPTSVRWLVYDSFGRLIRYSGDDNGDGSEDWATTYGYGADGNRMTAHVASPAQTYDRAYRYDDQGRIVELDQDDGPDGVVDETTRFQYDDATRVTTRTVTDAAGQTIESGTTTYDIDNHVLSVLAQKLDASGSPVMVTDSYTYATGRLVSESHVTITRLDGISRFLTTRYAWNYDHCP